MALEPLNTLSPIQPESCSQVVPDNNNCGAVVEEHETFVPTPELHHLELQEDLITTNSDCLVGLSGILNLGRPGNGLVHLGIG